MTTIEAWDSIAATVNGVFVKLCERIHAPKMLQN